MTRREMLAGGAALMGIAVAPPDDAGYAPDGDLRLTLVGAVGKKGRGGKDRSDLDLDLTRRSGIWQPQAWSFADDYSTSDGYGTAGILENGDHLTAHVYLDIAADATIPATAAKYDLTLKRTGTRFEGTYRGQFDTKRVEGKVTGEYTPPYPALPPPGFVPVAPGEHPRLIFRAADAARIRERATTHWGRAIVARLRERLAQPIIYRDNFGGANSDYFAAGQAFLYFLTGNPAAAAMARTITEKAMPVPGLAGDGSPPLLGLALAYDFCYSAWEEGFRRRVADYLAKAAAAAPASDSAGIALLAIAGEPEATPENERRLTACERWAARYLAHRVGEHGYGVAGDYLFMGDMERLLVFLQALRTVRGREMAGGVRGAGAAWALPLYVLRSFVENGAPRFYPYGWFSQARTAFDTPPGLFATGLGSVSASHLPAVREFIDRFWGLAGDKTFAIEQPHHAAFLLALYPDAVPAQPASALLPHALQDVRTGFFLFRSGDFVTTLYAKTTPDIRDGLEAGDFRIHGLGVDWTVPSHHLGRAGWNVAMAPYRVGDVDISFGSGRVLYYEGGRDGSGAVGLDLSGVYQEEGSHKDPSIRSDRAFVVDYSGQCGAPALFVVGDRISGGSNRVWWLHTAGTAVSLTPDGFMIDGGNGATLRATFVSPAPVRLSVIDESQPVKTVEARSDDPKTATFFVIMTVQQGAAPAVVVQGTGPNRIVTVGGVPVRWVEGTTAPPKKATPSRK